MRWHLFADLVQTPGRTFEARQLRRIGAGNPHLEDVIDDSIVVVAEPCDRAKTLHIDLAVVANGIVTNMDALDLGKHNVHRAFRTIPRQAVRAEIAALEMDGRFQNSRARR